MRIDLHRLAVIVRQTEAGEQISVVRIDNDLVALGLEIARAGPNPEVVLEALTGKGWNSCPESSMSAASR